MRNCSHGDTLAHGKYTNSGMVEHCNIMNGPKIASDGALAKSQCTVSQVTVHWLKANAPSLGDFMILVVY